MVSHTQSFSFDLVSDLYIDVWSQPITWDGLGTSLLAVVAGDISSDLDRTIYELNRIGKAYRQVLYIDGDLEHQNSIHNVHDNRNYIAKKLKNTNITYLHEQVVCVKNVAFVGANLWWNHLNDECNTSENRSDDNRAFTLHLYDLEYLRLTVSRLQTVNSIEKIVLVTHTVPNQELVSNVHNGVNFSVDASEIVEKEDRNEKMNTWCFGHWTCPIDFQGMRCRYISNPMGYPDDCDGSTYFPLRVSIK